MQPQPSALLPFCSPTLNLVCPDLIYTMPCTLMNRVNAQFHKLCEFGERMGGAPELTGLTHLTVAGRVRFGRGVRLRGNVIIIASDDREICIPDGATLENVVVTGALSILDH